MKNSLIHWAIGGGAFWLLSAAAHSLPTPEPMGSKLYLFVFNLAQNLLANFNLKK
jgi:hypothetical protein